LLEALAVNGAARSTFTPVVRYLSWLNNKALQFSLPLPVVVPGFCVFLFSFTPVVSAANEIGQ
jgi:hypothetical protein